MGVDHWIDLTEVIQRHIEVVQGQQILSEVGQDHITIAEVDQGLKGADHFRILHTPQ